MAELAHPDDHHPVDHRRAGTLVRLVGAVLAAGVACALAVLPVVGGAALVALRTSDRFLHTRCDVTLAATQQTTRILASDGTTVLARLFDQNRQDVPLSQIPMSVRQALVATEDRALPPPARRGGAGAAAQTVGRWRRARPQAPALRGDR